MSLYECNRCNKIFSQNGDLKRHFNRKFKCKINGNIMIEKENINLKKNENYGNEKSKKNDFKKESNDFKKESNDFKKESNDFKKESNDFKNENKNGEKRENGKKNENEEKKWNENGKKNENENKNGVKNENGNENENKNGVKNENGNENENKNGVKNENGNENENKNGEKNKNGNENENKNGVKNENGNKNFFCDLCGSGFTRKNNMNYHKKMKRCKILKLDNSKEISNNIKPTQVNITQNYNTTTNTLNQLNQVNQNINAFGKESINLLPSEMMNKVIKNPESGIPFLVEYIHFNPNTPKNHNVRMKNKNDNFINVYNGNLWKYEDKKETIHNLIVSKKDIADDYFDNEMNNFDNFTKLSYERYTDSVDNYINDMLFDKDETEKNAMITHYKTVI